MIKWNSYRPHRYHRYHRFDRAKALPASIQDKRTKKRETACFDQLPERKSEQLDVAVERRLAAYPVMCALMTKAAVIIAAVGNIVGGLYA